MAKHPAPVHLLKFRELDPRRVRALLADAPAPRPSIQRGAGTRRTLERAGLTDEEIRLLQGFRGLPLEERATLLAYTNQTVFDVARTGGRS